MSLQGCKGKKKGHDKHDDPETENEFPPFEEVRAFPELTVVEFPTSSAVDVGVGDVSDSTLGTRVNDTSARNVYMRFTSVLGNIRIWKVADERFMFSVDDENMRFITAYQWNGNWYVLWMPGSDPAGVTDANMGSDSRVWEVYSKFSDYFIRLEMRKQLYLNSDREAGKLNIMDVGDPDNTREVTPLKIEIV
ncbi:uncharacterized protein LOC120326121 [Styela clava]